MADVPVAGVAAADEGGAGTDVPVDTASIVAKYQASLYQAAPSVFDPTPAPAAAAPEAPAPAPAPVPAPAVETPPAAEEPTLRARQLVALQKKEQELREWEERLKSTETKPAPRTASMDDFLEQFAIDPITALKGIGIDDTAGAATRILAMQLGDDAPPELRQQMALRKMEAELAAIKQRVSKRDEEVKDAPQKAVYAARVEATDRELRSFVSAVPAELKFLTAAAQDNADEVYQGLCTIAASHIRAGKFPSAREAAQALEDALAADYSRLSKAVTPAPAPASPPAPIASPPRPPETLSDADTQGRPALGSPITQEQMDDPQFWTNRAMDKLRALGLR